MTGPRLPDGFAVQVDRRVKVLGEGSALLGGSPTRLLRLAPAAQTMLNGGRLEVHDAVSAHVARTLLDATVAHPRPASGPSHRDLTIVIPVRDNVFGLRRLLATLRDLRIVATALSGADPTIMLTGPAPASRKALAKAGLTVSDIDLFEINEAFAAVALRFMKDMGISHERTNVNGGAIAMGHPLGATGAMILGTLVDELERRELRYGLATLCVGGGMGIATIVERVA